MGSSCSLKNSQTSQVCFQSIVEASQALESKEKQILRVDNNQQHQSAEQRDSNQNALQESIGWQKVKSELKKEIQNDFNQNAPPLTNFDDLFVEGQAKLKKRRSTVGVVTLTEGSYNEYKEDRLVSFTINSLELNQQKIYKLKKEEKLDQ